MGSQIGEAAQGKSTGVEKGAENSSSGIPLMPSQARQIIMELLDQKSPWKRQDLAAQVEAIYLERGGVKGTQSTIGVVKKALQQLATDGLAANVAPGFWAKPTPREDSLSSAEDDLPESTVDGLVDESEDLAPERTIGEGPETVYLYFNPNDRRLSELEGRDTWECKIGRSASEIAADRILAQGAKTALSHLPIVGLVIQTQDSAALEKALHASLRLVEREVLDSPGAEWFLTSPSKVEAWFLTYEASLAHLHENLRTDSD